MRRSWANSTGICCTGAIKPESAGRRRIGVAVGRRFPGVRPLGDPALEPFELHVDFGQLVAQLDEAVRLAGRDVERGRDAEALEGAMHLEGLRQRHPRVLLADDE